MERFAIENRFDATVEEFEAVLNDAELYERLAAAMPGIQRIEPLERDEDDREVRRRTRYTPNVDGKIPAFGRAFVKPSMLSWIEESRYDKAAHRFAYRIVPNLPHAWRDRFDSHGAYTLAAQPSTAGGGVLRRIEGEIVVRVPLFGGRVERMLRAEVEHNFASEARAIAAWLRERRAP
jgi:hypothetical protein